MLKPAPATQHSLLVFSEPQEQQGSMKLPGFPCPLSLLHPWLVLAPWVSDPQAQLPCSMQGCFLPSCLSFWPALACVLATWPLSARFTFPVCCCGSTPLCFLHFGQECGLPRPGSGLPWLPCPSPSCRCSMTKTRCHIPGRLASFQLISVDFRSGSEFSLWL